MKANTIFLKQLTKLGNVTAVTATAIVRNTQVFRSVPRSRGYAIPYTLEMALLISVGSDLMHLGLSLRHINLVLCAVTGFIEKCGMEEMVNACEKEKHILTVVFVDKYQIEPPPFIGGWDLVTREFIETELKTRQSWIRPELFTESEYFEIEGHYPSHIRIDFSLHMHEVERLYK